MLVDESTKFQDIVQLDTYDSYYNLTLKTVGTLTRASKHRTTPKFPAKIDDNLVDFLKILKFARLSREKHDKLFGGDIRKSIVPTREGK